jgi:hypothetical protein
MRLTKIHIVSNAEWRFSDFFPALILPAGLTQTTSSLENAVQNLCPATGA